MSSVVIAGDVAGSITLQAPSSAGSTVLTLPAVSGTVLTSTSPQSSFPPNIAGNGPAFSAYQSSAQTLASNTGTKLTFTSTDFDTTAGMYSSSRFTPTVAGYYQVNSTMTWNTVGTRGFLNIYKNGTAFKQGSFIGTCDAATVNALVFLNGSTDYIEMYGQLTVGQALNATSQYTYFQAFLARSA